MSRYLFVFPPFVGHVSPAAGVAHELERRGHEVAWVAHDVAVGQLLGEGAKVYPAGDGFIAAAADLVAERDRLRGLAALKFLWDRVLLPLAAEMADHVRAAVDDFRPDVVVTDQMCFAGGIVAEERGVRWAVSACSTADLVDFGVPTVSSWMRERIADLCTDLGHPDLAAAGFDPRYSPRLVVEYSTRALVGDIATDRPQLVFVGPVAPEWSDDASFPWEWLDRYEQVVLVTLGTLSQGIGDRFLEQVFRAVEAKPYGVVMTGDPSVLPEPPGNVLLRPFVPIEAVLPRVDAMLCHAGHGTALGALAHGVPLVCAPIRDDQPITAEQVATSGAGLRLRFARVTPGEVADAVDAVLHEPSYRQAAERIARSFVEAGGAPAAADRLEALASPAMTMA